MFCPNLLILHNIANDFNVSHQPRYDYDDDNELWMTMISVRLSLLAQAALSGWHSTGRIRFPVYTIRYCGRSPTAWRSAAASRSAWRSTSTTAAHRVGSTRTETIWRRPTRTEYPLLRSSSGTGRAKRWVGLMTISILVVQFHNAGWDDHYLLNNRPPSLRT